MSRGTGWDEFFGKIFGRKKVIGFVYNRSPFFPVAIPVLDLLAPDSSIECLSIALSGVSEPPPGAKWDRVDRGPISGFSGFWPIWPGSSGLPLEGLNTSSNGL